MRSWQESMNFNQVNWDERAPMHARSPDYRIKRLIAEPTFLSPVVQFDVPLLGDITGLKVIHLQCHIGTDTLSIARRGASSVVGLDFSPASIHEARALAAQAAGGEKVTYVPSNVYDALSTVEGAGSFDLVFTGVGALCWLPSISKWAQVVSGLLKPGGRLFIREGHPVLWSADETVSDRLQMKYEYFESEEGLVETVENTYACAEDGGSNKLNNITTVSWNHGMGEIVQALLDVGMTITGLVEHRSIPWDALPGQMVEHDDGNEWSLRHNKNLMPLSYTLQARKP